MEERHSVIIRMEGENVDFYYCIKCRKIVSPEQVIYIEDEKGAFIHKVPVKIVKEKEE